MSNPLSSQFECKGDGLWNAFMLSESITTDCFLLSDIRLSNDENLPHTYTLSFVDAEGLPIQFCVLVNVKYAIIDDNFRGVVTAIPTGTPEVKLGLNKECEERLRHLFEYGN